MIPPDDVRKWLGRFSRLSEALHPDCAKVAVVDERGVNVASEEAWMRLAMEPTSREASGCNVDLEKEHSRCV